MYFLNSRLVSFQSLRAREHFAVKKVVPFVLISIPSCKGALTCCSCSVHGGSFQSLRAREHFHRRAKPGSGGSRFNPFVQGSISLSEVCLGAFSVSIPSCKGAFEEVLNAVVAVHLSIPSCKGAFSGSPRRCCPPCFNPFVQGSISVIPYKFTALRVSIPSCKGAFGAPAGCRCCILFQSLRAREH